jgi:uncharacterized protein
LVTKDNILNVLKQNSGHLAKVFSVQRIGLFGSFARNEQRSESDIDILVEFSEPTYDHYIELKYFLESHFQHSVDLIMADALKIRLKPYVDQEIIYAEG